MESISYVPKDELIEVAKQTMRINAEIHQITSEYKQKLSMYVESCEDLDRRFFAALEFASVKRFQRADVELMKATPTWISGEIKHVQKSVENLRENSIAVTEMVRDFTSRTDEELIEQYFS